MDMDSAASDRSSVETPVHAGVAPALADRMVRDEAAVAWPISAGDLGVWVEPVLDATGPVADRVGERPTLRLPGLGRAELLRVADRLEEDARRMLESARRIRESAERLAP